MITIYNELFNKNLSPVEINNTAELNYILFVKHILIQIFRLIENMDKNTIISKINIIPKAIKFAWDYQFDENFTLSIDPKKYKIFINQNNQLKYIQNVYLKEGDFEGIKNTEIENELFKLSKSKIINSDYNELFLEKNYENILGDKYKTNFKSMRLIEICQNEIDNKISDYFYNNEHANLMNKEYHEFRDIYFSLNKIINQKPILKRSFPNFMRLRGKIALKFLECNEQQMNDFIEDIERIVKFLEKE